MIITVHTNEDLNDLDRKILALLSGTTESVVVPEEKPVAKKPVAKKAAAKKPVEEKPDPIAEEPIPEEPEEPEVEETDDDGQSDEDLLALAIKKATEMVAGGDATKVREALDAAGANRVRELNKDNVRDFFKALA